MCIEHTYMIMNSDDSITWQSGNNPSFITGSSGSRTLNDAW
ncbi:hypothetical protein ACFYZB_20340 [Streptomyces sp. NPDC001852]